VASLSCSSLTGPPTRERLLGALLTHLRQTIARVDQVQNVDLIVAVHVELPVLAREGRLFKMVADTDHVENVDRTVAVGVTWEALIQGVHYVVGVHSDDDALLASRLRCAVHIPLFEHPADHRLDALRSAQLHRFSAGARDHIVGGQSVGAGYGYAGGRIGSND
jgi:hypothetical protein